MSAASLLRERREDGHSPVTFIELFFDLVFVLAVTQLSHRLVDNLTLLGLAETALLFIAVWWVWIDTGWVTNWLDPERPAVRLMLLALMLGGLALSTSIPHAFERSALPFALAYAAMQIGRNLFMIWAFRGADKASRRNFARIAIWHSLSSALWIAGALVEAIRLPLWVCAAAVDIAAPALGFHVPGLGRSTTGDWQVSGAHIAERCALFVIIALGESILLIGASVIDRAWSGSTVAALVASFVGSAAMWWIYFDVGAKHGTRQIEQSDDPGRLARLAYTYLHLPIVAGIIVVAVGDELVLAHPDGAVNAALMLTAIGGPALYVTGTMLFKWAVSGRAAPPLSHIIGLGCFATLAIVAIRLEPLAIGVLATAILIAIAILEWAIAQEPDRNDDPGGRATDTPL